MISQKITIYEMGERKLKCRVEKCHSNRCYLTTFEVVFKPSRISRCTMKHFSNKILDIAHQSKIMSIHFQICCASFCQLHFFELLEIHICVFDTKMQHATNCHCRNIQLAIRALVSISFSALFPLPLQILSKKSSRHRREISMAKKCWRDLVNTTHATYSQMYIHTCALHSPAMKCRN